MKPTVTIIYNVALAIVSLTLLYGYFNHLVYEKTFSKEKQEQKVVPPPLDKENSNAVDSTNIVAVAPNVLTNHDSGSLVNNESFLSSSQDSINTKKETTTNLSETSELKKKELVNFLDMLVVMFLAGMLGGVLANLRGVFEFYREEKGFPNHLFIPYLIRPLTAAISGLLIFFISHLIISSTAPSYDNEHITFKGMVSFMSLAIISGFASQEFTERLKAAASTLFGISPNEASPTPNPAPVDPKTNGSDETVHIPTENSPIGSSSDSTTPSPQINPTSTPQQKPLGKRYMNRD